MSLVGYTTPSPAAKQFTVAGIQCAIDVFYRTDIKAVNLVLVEKSNINGAWGYLGGSEAMGWIWECFCLNAPLGLGTQISYTAPGRPAVGGTFTEIVALVGANGMVDPWIPFIQNAVAQRFGGGEQPVSQTDRTPQETAAQQSIAGAINGLTVAINGNTISVGRP